jgi:hypothetical protein
MKSELGLVSGQAGEEKAERVAMGDQKFRVEESRSGSSDEA